jgi:hypothetical protein
LNVDRKKYYDTLRKADNGDSVPFVNFVAMAVERSLDLYLRSIEPTTEEDKLMTLAEASKISPYNQEYLSLLARKRRIGAVKEGDRWMITRRALKHYLRQIGKENGKASKRITPFAS